MDISTETVILQHSLIYSMQQRMGEIARIKNPKVPETHVEADAPTKVGPSVLSENRCMMVRYSANHRNIDCEQAQPDPSVYISLAFERNHTLGIYAS